MSPRTQLGLTSPEFMLRVADAAVRKLEDELALAERHVRRLKDELAKARARRAQAVDRFSRRAR